MTAQDSQFIRIPMPDGRSLSARLWRPSGGAPVPAILEFRPYRGFDLFRALEDQYLPVWAAHGYAVLAVDTAGSGQSTGLLADEYLPREIEDAIAAVDWCAGQAWCDGAVGLSGMSWSAFTALRVAAQRPAALKALALGGVSEDGWRTDIHNLGGAMYAARVDWAGVMLQLNALPPDPLDFGEDWLATWRQRLAADRPWIIPWLSHPARDAYWADKAVDVAAIDLPLFLYAGWADKYATSVLRIAAAWRGPVRTIVGPWEHTIPDLARRKPRIDYLGEALAWWDHWLKGAPNGAMDPAPLRAWIGAPDREGRVDEGRWAAMDGQTPARMWTLRPAGEGRLAEEAAIDRGQLRLAPAPTTPPALGVDRYEDTPGPIDLEASAAGAAVLMTDPMADDVEVCGSARLELSVRASAPGGQVVARLVDIDPAGAAVRMTTGALNLRPQGDPGRVAPVPAGVTAALTVDFQAAGWRLRRGHRLGLVLSADGWPTLWPDGVGAGLHIDVSSLALSVPTLGASAGTAAFEEATRTLRADVAALKWIDPQAEVLPTSGLDGAAIFEARSAAHHLPATGTDYFSASRFSLALADDGRQAAAEKVARTVFERPGWSVRVDTRLAVTSTVEAFQIAWTVRAEHSGTQVHDHSEKVEILRGVV